MVIWSSCAPTLLVVGRLSGGVSVSSNLISREDSSLTGSLRESRERPETRALGERTKVGDRANEASHALGAKRHCGRIGASSGSCRVGTSVCIFVGSVPKRVDETSTFGFGGSKFVEFAKLQAIALVKSLTLLDSSTVGIAMVTLSQVILLLRLLMILMLLLIAGTGSSILGRSLTGMEGSTIGS